MRESRNTNMRKNTLNTKFYILHSSPGFTFVELMIVLALIGIMAGIVVIYIDPPRQLAKARNNRRWANVSTVLNAVGENIADNKGTFSCVSGELPTSTKRMAPGAENYDIAPCLVPNYLPNLPFDPSASGARYSSTT